MNKLKAAALVAIFFILTPTFAQRTTVYTDTDAEFKTGVELFQKEKFGAAQKSFTKVIESHTDTRSLVRIDAEYYNAICAIELFNKDGELYLKQFVKDHPESPKVKSAYFYLGKYNYRKKKYKEGLDWFEKVDLYDLSKDDLAEFYFKRGYCYFSSEKFAEAKKDFYEIKDVDNKYAAAAKYYYAHIAYAEKNYETALTDFLKLQQNETFGPIVPYYIAQLYYLEGKFDQVIAYAPALLDSASTKRAPEIARIIGESYYRTNRYGEAIPFLKKYEKGAGKLPRQDQYEMGYAYYKINQYEDAIDYFIGVTNIDDTLSQNAYYHLGDSYLKMSNKQNARNAFGEASKMDFDKSIQEDALFSYAKLCYELAFNPYNEAIKAFQKYIKDYPNSARLDEAYTYLVNVFTTTKNYKGAVEAIESIKTPTPELKQAHQKVAYYRGVDLFNNGDYAEAIKSFDKSMTYAFDKNITAQATYWKAESYYRSKDYAKSIEYYIDYTGLPGAIGKSELSDANYNVGYAYNKIEDYTNSILWFRKFVTFKPEADPKKINDALNRIGDGYFMNRDFANAADYYDQSYKMKLMNPDYALMQKALANGVQKKYAAKSTDLQTLIASYPTSGYIQKAKLELALSYMLGNQNDQALASFQAFLKDYPGSKYENICFSKMGLIYYNRKEDDQALAYFDKLIRKDKQSSDSKEAIEISKKIFEEKGNVIKLEEWLASIGASISQIALDSIAFDIGKKHEQQQADCKVIVADFAQYIQKFPQGIFITDANYYKADCDYKLGNMDDALTEYLFVISKPKSLNTEQCLLRASDIVFKKQNFTQAIDLYKQLEQITETPKNNSVAKVGLMRSSFQLKNYQDAIDYSNKVLGLEKVSAELSNEAMYTIAQCYMATQKFDDAFASFKALSNSAKNEYGAEASYNVAYLLFMKNEFKQSQKSVFDFLNGEGDYPYWVTKAMIVLADDYVGLKDNFQAKTTLKGIIGDSDIPELIKIAQEKLDKITADEEAAKQQKTVQEPLKVEFQGNSTEQNKLFIESDSLKQDGGIKHE